MLAVAEIEAVNDAVPIHPGHPLVLALKIMQTYPNYAAANATTSYGWIEVLGDDKIPGTRDNVFAAMLILDRGQRGDSIENMIAQANVAWQMRAGRHSGNVAAGLAQASRLEPEFRALVRTWLK